VSCCVLVSDLPRAGWGSCHVAGDGDDGGVDASAAFGTCCRLASSGAGSCRFIEGEGDVGWRGREHSLHTRSTLLVKRLLQNCFTVLGLHCV